MLKTAAFYLSFLGLLSVIYHMIYWGQFDIDIFQFISAQDLITGIAYPLRTAAAFAAIYLLMIALTYSYVQKNNPLKLDMRASIQRATGVTYGNFTDPMHWAENAHNQNPSEFVKALQESQYRAKLIKRNVTYIGAIIAFVFGICYFTYFSTNTWFASWTAFFIASLFLILSQYAYGRFDNILELKSKKEYWVAFIDEFIITMIIFLPVNAALAGYTEAQRVLTRENYKYINTSDIALTPSMTHASKLVYLGKVNTTYFFTSLDFSQHFVVPTDKVPALNYQVYDAQQ